MFRAFTFITVVILCQQAFAQTVRLGTDSGYIVAHLAERELRSALPDREYYWVRAQALHRTQGGAGGTVLHGDYKAYHPNGQLQTAGCFKKGLKHGEWRSWRSDGNLEWIERWRSGRLHGNVEYIDPQGRLKETVRYRSGEVVEKRAPLFKELFKRKDSEKEVDDSNDVTNDENQPAKPDRKVKKATQEKADRPERKRKKKERKEEQEMKDN